jgi:hypothetical protein
MLASLADVNTSDHQETVAADRDIPREPHWGSFPACVALVSGSDCGAEYSPHRFTNANAMLHVANCLANAGRIESGSSYKFYAEGVTPAVARLYEAINAERVAVAAALGASVPTLADWFDRVYGVREATLVETCQRLTCNSNGPYQATGTPKSLDHKSSQKTSRPASYR